MTPRMQELAEAGKVNMHIRPSILGTTRVVAYRGYTKIVDCTSNVFSLAVNVAFSCATGQRYEMTEVERKANWWIRNNERSLRWP